MRKRLAIPIVLAVLALALLACVFQVDETEYVIVARFGDPSRVIEDPGLYFKWPPPIDSVIRIDRRIKVLDPGPSEYLTSEKKNVLVSCFMAWSVKDPRRFLVTVTDERGAESRLTDIMASEVGSILGSHPLDVLVSTTAGDAERLPGEVEPLDMDDVMGEITRNAAAKALEDFGIEVAAVRIKRLNFPDQNKQAVFRRMEAERERIAMQYRSEGEEAADNIRSRVNREKAELVNKAKRRAEEIRGEADAEATGIYAKAYGEDPRFYEFLRSLEVYAKIVRENSTLVIPSDSRILRVLESPDSYLQALKEKKE